MREENFINEENRFCSSLNTFDFLDENGKVIENPAAYLEEKAKSMITYGEKCAIGDVVILKGTELHVKITDVDYKTASVLSLIMPVIICLNLIRENIYFYKEILKVLSHKDIGRCYFGY